MNPDLGLSFDLPSDVPTSVQEEYFRTYQQQAMGQQLAAGSMTAAGVPQQSVQGIPQQMPNGAMVSPSMAAAAADASGAGVVGAEMGYDDEFGAFMDDESQEDFVSGLMDTSLLLVSALAGSLLDPMLEKKLGVRGYGLILGATIGNAISCSLGASSEGSKSMGMTFLGSLVPIVPVTIGLALRKELTGTTRNIMLGTSLLGLGYSVAARRNRRRK